ncbi:MAG: hypothetical protein HY381_00835 [Candidatus Chisholmbacteria bacterium]|nr:hypothetical protein [Candidatus Chisholmbacteria bacterium]
MIELGEKYFDLRQLKNLRVVRRDAFEWLGSNRGKFDLILVDLYLGRRVPKRAETRKFLYRLRDRLKTKRGAILFNRLKLKDLKINNEQFRQGLEKVFGAYRIIKTPANELLLVE